MRRPAFLVLTAACSAALAGPVVLAAPAGAAPHASVPSAALVQAVATVPSAPVSASATHDDATAAAVLAWQPPASTGGSPVTGYRVARDGTDAAGAGPWSGSVAATTRSFRFTRLVPGRAYQLSVQAVNAVGRSVASAVPVVLGVPSAPTAVVPDSGTSSTARIAWSPPSYAGTSAVTGYGVARDGIDATGRGPWSGTVSATTRAFTFTDLVPGRRCTLTVQALNAQGRSPAGSRTVAVVPMAVDGEHLAYASSVRVDPSGTTFVLTTRKGTQERFAMAATDRFVHGLDTG